MSGKVLSVIIPTFNVDKYLIQCLESFVIDEIRNDIEVLIVNDGSTDHSLELASDFSTAYPETFRIITKENGGHGSTINRGIEEACGTYFRVVDGDDWVDQKGFTRLVSALKTCDADLVFTNYEWVDHSSGKHKKEVLSLCKDIKFGKVYPADEVLDKTFLKMHAMTYRTRLLKEMPVRLDEHSFYVDTEYVMFPLPYVKTLLFLEDVVYQYRIGLETQSMSMDNLRKRCSQHERVLSHLLQYYKVHRDNKNAKSMARVISRMATSQCKIDLSLGGEGKDKMLKLERHLQEQYPEIYSSITHPSIRLLRITRYRLYKVVSWLVQKVCG